MDTYAWPPSRFSDPTKNLPGCRTCDVDWDRCELGLHESRDGVVISFKVAKVGWKRKVKKRDGRLQCNLQELEILRWIAEGKEANKAATRLKRYQVGYKPQKRYSCIYPHGAATAHGILEIVPQMSSEELHEVGEEAIRDFNVLLCPALSSTCNDASHTSVDQEVYKLSAHWPVRQVVCAAVVEGMIDISPVAICRNDPTHPQCTVFEEGRAENAGPPIEIRTNAPLTKMLRDVERIIWNGRKNPRTILHSSWDGNLPDVIQPAVLQCQYRKATTQPTRLYDAHDRVLESGIWPDNYLALSYCWQEWPEDDGIRLPDKLEELSKRLGVRYFWVDRWCIDQEDDADKAREIARMREYYMGASGCVVLAGPNVQPFRCVPQHNGAILSAYQQIEQNLEGLRSLLECKWATRLWTLQEALLSRQMIYAVQDQLIDGDYISELVAYIETFSRTYTGDPEDPEWIGGYGCYGWNARAPTVVYPRQFNIEKGSQKLTVIRSIFGGEQQYNELQSTYQGIIMPFEQALIMTKERQASNEEDFVYGVLGISEGGDKIHVEYNISWRTMLEKLSKAGMITERQLASPTVNELPGMSWLPKCESGYGPFNNMERISAFVPRPRLSWSDQGAAVQGVVFEWKEPQYERWDVLNIHGMPCHVVRGYISFPDAPEVIARVAGTSESQFTEKRLRGTHVMLNRDVDENTKDTVAIKVGGDIGAGRVYRQDGYVLEIYQWLSGSPELLQGKHWLIGGKNEHTRRYRRMSCSWVPRKSHGFTKLVDKYL